MRTYAFIAAALVIFYCVIACSTPQRTLSCKSDQSSDNYRAAFDSIPDGCVLNGSFEGELNVTMRNGKPTLLVMPPPLVTMENGVMKSRGVALAEATGWVSWRIPSGVTHRLLITRMYTTSPFGGENGIREEDRILWVGDELGRGFCLVDFDVTVKQGYQGRLIKAQPGEHIPVKKIWKLRGRL